ncbi:hypothetical protein PCANC_28098 [Puccinia coronata f. sp. avenae]|uniref:Uncharacterized protein n=1 Tax=Puccinia coronata f. sp. avenae TaxID=200324 RepID=A0A2N5RUU8_9BASI|nr:hypothetical protein PCANC_28098 [Puccinia coronata f. sp. avenae]
MCREVLVGSGSLPRGLGRQWLPAQRTWSAALPALTGRTRRFEQCSIRRVRPVIGPACPTGWERLQSDMPVRSLVKRGGSTGARPTLFDQLMLAECQH